MARSTSRTLLAAVLNPNNQVAWERFYRFYCPMLLGFARRLRLQDTDAEDMVQEVMLTVRSKLPQYDRSRAKFSTWLRGIAFKACLRIRRRLRRRHVQPPDISGTAFLDRLQDASPSPLEEHWEQEWREFVWQKLRKALSRSKPRDLQVFELHGRQKIPAREVAERLGMTPERVREVKHEVLNRLRLVALELDLQD